MVAGLIGFSRRPHLPDPDQRSLTHSLLARCWLATTQDKLQAATGLRAHDYMHAVGRHYSLTIESAQCALLGSVLGHNWVSDGYCGFRTTPEDRGIVSSCWRPCPVHSPRPTTADARDAPVTTVDIAACIINGGRKLECRYFSLDRHL